MIVPEPPCGGARPGNRPPVHGTPAAGFPLRLPSHPRHPRRTALRREPLLLQPLSLRIGLAQPRAPPASRRVAQLQQRPHAGELPRAPLQFPGHRRAVGGRFRALPASTVTAHPAARRTRRRHPVQRHRGIVQPGRRHPRRGLSPHPRRIGGAPRRAPPGRRLPVRLQRHLARQAGRQRAELQLRYRPHVRLRRQWRDRRPGGADQQGILQEGGQPVHRPALQLHRRGPVLSRRPAPPPGRNPGRDRRLRGRRPRFTTASAPATGRSRC